MPRSCSLQVKLKTYTDILHSPLDKAINLWKAISVNIKNTLLAGKLFFVVVFIVDLIITIFFFFFLQIIIIIVFIHLSWKLMIHSPNINMKQKYTNRKSIF